MILVGILDTFKIVLKALGIPKKMHWNFRVE